MQGSYEARDTGQRDCPSDIIGERSEAELGADVFNAPHQKRVLTHPLLDRPERMFHALLAYAHHPWSCRQPGCHAIQNRFVFQTRDTPECFGAFVAKGTSRAGFAIGIIDFLIVP